MATYKGTKGFTIQNLSADPPAPILGQVWYNSTSNVLKGYASVAGAWASGGNRNTGVQGAPGAGAQTAAITAGGNPTPGLLQVITETYNGTAWTSVANLPGAGIYNNSITGTTTAALMFGGAMLPSHAPVTRTVSWDGTSWSIVNSLNSANVHMAENIGIQTASLSCGGGHTPAPVAGAVNELWDGTSWTEVANINTGRSSASGNGSTTAALIYGGSSNPPLRDFTESWNGTSWTEIADLVNARESCGSSMQGSTISTIVFGGNSPAFSPNPTDKTEEWNGTSWTEVALLANNRAQCGGAGTASVGLCFGGIISGTPSIMTSTEEWNSGNSVVTFTSS